MREHIGFQTTGFTAARYQQEVIDTVRISFKIPEIVEIQSQTYKGVSLMPVNRQFEYERTVIVKLAKIIVKEGVI